MKKEKQKQKHKTVTNKGNKSQHTENKQTKNTKNGGVHCMLKNCSLT